MPRRARRAATPPRGHRPDEGGPARAPRRAAARRRPVPVALVDRAPREAHSAATGSPRLVQVAQQPVISARSSPCRRGVGATDTQLTPATGAGRRPAPPSAARTSRPSPRPGRRRARRGSAPGRRARLAAAVVRLAARNRTPPRARPRRSLEAGVGQGPGGRSVTASVCPRSRQRRGARPPSLAVRAPWPPAEGVAAPGAAAPARLPRALVRGCGATRRRSGAALARPGRCSRCAARLVRLPSSAPAAVPPGVAGAAAAGRRPAAGPRPMLRAHRVVAAPAWLFDVVPTRLRRGRARRPARRRRHRPRRVRVRPLARGDRPRRPARRHRARRAAARGSPSRAGCPRCRAGWRAEAVVRPAGGGPFAGDFVVSRPAPAAAGGSSSRSSTFRQGRRGGHPRAAAVRRARRPARREAPEDFLPAANAYLVRQDWDEGFATAVHLVARPGDAAPTRSRPPATRRSPTSTRAPAAGASTEAHGHRARAAPRPGVRRRPRAGSTRATPCCSTPTGWSRSPAATCRSASTSCSARPSGWCRAGFTGGARRARQPGRRSRHRTTAASCCSGATH